MKRHPIYSRFEVHFIQCPEVIGEDICGNETITVSGYFNDPEDAFTIESLVCGDHHEIDVDSLSDFDRTRIEERAELHRGDAYASYCSYVEDMEE